MVTSNLKIPQNTSIIIKNTDIETLNKNDLLYTIQLDNNFIYAKNKYIKTIFNISKTDKKPSHYAMKDKIIDLDANQLLRFIRTTRVLLNSNRSIDVTLAIIDNVGYLIISNSYTLYLVKLTEKPVSKLNQAFLLRDEKIKILEQYISTFKDANVKISLYEYNLNAGCINITHADSKNMIDSSLQLLIEVKNTDIVNIKERKIDIIDSYMAIKSLCEFTIDQKIFTKSLTVISGFINTKLTIATQILMIFEDNNVVITQTDRSGRKIEVIIGSTLNSNRKFIVNDAILNAISASMANTKEPTSVVKIRELYEHTYLLTVNGIHIAFES